MSTFHQHISFNEALMHYAQSSVYNYYAYAQLGL